MKRAAQTAWAAAVLDAFAAAGITDVVASPGSRSTPFVAAALAQRRLRCHHVVDERSAGFFALGLAKATGRPPLLLCTSGSAPAHYYPAVVEAATSFTPLVILTADRPPELQGCGAAQTIDQIRLFGVHARASLELPGPDAPDAARRAAFQAVTAALFPVPGAVQVNGHARKPLEPAAAAAPGRPTFRRASPGRLVPDPAAVDELARACLRARRGIIVAGPAAVAQAGARDDVAALLAATGFPLLAEAGSQLRPLGHAIDPTARLLDAPADLVLQLGAMPTPAAWEQYLRRHPPRALHVIAAHGWPDAFGLAQSLLVADVAAAARALAARVAELRPASRSLRIVAPRPRAVAARRAWRDRGAARGWPARVAQAAGRARAAVTRLLGAGDLTEGHVAAATVAAADWLVVGNSLPVRTVEIFADVGARPVVVQRGASGIDGLVAGAAGVAAAGHDVTLLVGDLALLHDVGSLALAHAQPRLRIVVVNNGGGRIFEQLPIAAAVRDLTPWTTPHAWSFAHAAAQFDLGYARAATRAELSAALAGAARLIEAVVPAAGAAAQARALESLL